MYSRSPSQMMLRRIWDCKKILLCQENLVFSKIKTLFSVDRFSRPVIDLIHSRRVELRHLPNWFMFFLATSIHIDVQEQSGKLMLATESLISH